MSLSQALLPEYDHERASTRKYIDHFPEGKNDWKPHEKSMALAQLTSHIVETPGWLATTLETESLDLNPSDGEPYKPLLLDSRAALLEEFDRRVAAAREALAGASDEELMQPWTMLAGGETIFTLPRVAVIRSFVLNHVIHHRGQLGVYYRMLDVTLPAIYGPSADEQG